MGERATGVGLAQITSGLINLIIMSLGWFFLGSTVGGGVSAVVCGVMTLGMCPLPFGILCGFVGVFPLVLGVLEIISGILILTDTDRFRSFARAVAVLEVLSLFYGGVCSVIVGAFALVALKAGPESGETDELTRTSAIALGENETVEKAGSANVQRGVETVGGSLRLTNERLIFEAHALTIQGGPTVIARNDIVSIEPGWTKLLGILPIAPNTIAVTTRSGEDFRFVVMGRAAWMTALHSD